MEISKYIFNKKIIYITIFLIISLPQLTGYFIVNSDIRTEKEKTISEINPILDGALYYYNTNQFEKSIDEYNEILNIISDSKNPNEYAITQNNIGNAYLKFADFQNIEINALNAIDAYQKAINIYLKNDRYTIKYAETQNNLGKAYLKLADIRNVELNSFKAINASLEALKTFTMKSYSTDYAIAQNNLGEAYLNLADVRDKENNSEKAIIAFNETLKIFTKESYSTDYAIAQNNLGEAYLNLADVRDKENNSEKAIIAFNKTIKTAQEALNVYTRESHPINFAIIQITLGNAYLNSANIQDKKNNNENAIIVYLKGVEVFTIESYPLYYAMVQTNIGHAHNNLQKVYPLYESQKKADQYNKAIAAYNEALKIYNIDGYPIKYEMIQNSIKNLYGVEYTVSIGESLTTGSVTFVVT
jgi:tetratricopeptide (TPR) repeat protein